MRSEAARRSARHGLLVPGQQVTELRLHRGKTQAQVTLTPRLIVTDPWVVHAATAAGAGIGVLPEFLCRQGLAMNKLERVLPDWQVSDLLELHARLRPAAREHARRSRADRLLRRQHGAGAGAKAEVPWMRLRPRACRNPSSISRRSCEAQSALRAGITAAYRRGEPECLPPLLAAARLPPEAAKAVAARARKLVVALRARRPPAAWRA